MLSTANAGVVWALAMWYAASIGLIMFNKWALSYLGFHFPVAMMLLQLLSNNPSDPNEISPQPNRPLAFT